MDVGDRARPGAARRRSGRRTGPAGRAGRCAAPWGRRPGWVGLANRSAVRSSSSRSSVRRSASGGQGGVLRLAQRHRRVPEQTRSRARPSGRGDAAGCRPRSAARPAAATSMRVEPGGTDLVRPRQHAHSVHRASRAPPRRRGRPRGSAGLRRGYGAAGTARRRPPGLRPALRRHHLVGARGDVGRRSRRCPGCR